MIGYKITSQSLQKTYTVNATRKYQPVSDKLNLDKLTYFRLSSHKWILV